MGDYYHGNRHHNNNNRKRRFRDDDEFDTRRNARRRVDNAPLHVRVRRQLLSLGESSARGHYEEIQWIAQAVANNPENEELQSLYLDLLVQLTVEQPLRIPFVASTVIFANVYRGALFDKVLERVVEVFQQSVQKGLWRNVKLYLRFLACLQANLEGDGILSLLEDLFSRAVDLQTSNSEDTVGVEIVRIILLTIPYIVAADTNELHTAKISELMDKAEIIANEPHPLLAHVNPFVAEDLDLDVEGDASCPEPSPSVLSLLQKQLQEEAAYGWTVKCIPRPWRVSDEAADLQEKLMSAEKHILPEVVIPEVIQPGPDPIYPETHFSVYGGQDVDSVPPVTTLDAFIIRDAILDAIDVLDFNRHVAARCLIDLDCFFAEGTFIKRGTPFDRLTSVEAGRSTWKPEDTGVDAVFSRILQLPAPPRKVVYYHSVLTEACKIAPAAVAPSLGRAIRYLYRASPRMDLLVSQRFLGWFTHHLSNFGFTWKWSEWADDVALDDIHPSKAFILAAIDKEIRLSFAQRIKGTLPEEYVDLIDAEKEKDTPDFKYSDTEVPFSAEGQDIASALKRKGTENEIDLVLARVDVDALDAGLDSFALSVDVFVTAMCWVGSKSLSHTLACLERCKPKLVSFSKTSPEGPQHIITSIMTFWQSHIGVTFPILEKLIDFEIVTPAQVAEWIIGSQNPTNSVRPGTALAQYSMFELISNIIARLAKTIESTTRELAQDESTSKKSKGSEDDEQDSSNDQENGTNESEEASATAESNVAATERKHAIQQLRDLLTTLSSLSQFRTVANDPLIIRWATRWELVIRRVRAIYLPKEETD